MITEIDAGNLLTIGALIATAVSGVWAIKSSVSTLQNDNARTREAISDLTRAIRHLDARGDDHETRLVRLEERERIKTSA